jgi:predicted membrane protein
MKKGMSNKRIGIILIIIGFLFIINNFNIFDLGNSLWKLSPLLLVWWGFHLLRKRGTHTRSEGDFQVFGDTSTTTSSPFIRHSSAFGDIRVKIDNEEFSGGNVSSVFGKISLDLQGVERIGSYGQLDLHSVFGDITLRLPRDLAFEVEGTTMFGSITTPDGSKVSGGSYRSPESDRSEQILRLKPSLVFGDMEIIR